MPAATVPTASPAALAKTRAAIDRKQLYGWCNLTDVKNRKVYFSELFTYTGGRQDADAMGRAFMVDLKKFFGKKIVGDPLCSSTYSEEDERTERQQSLDMYTDITTVNYLRWKPVSN